MCQDAVDSKEEGEEEKKEYRKGEKRTLTPNTGLLLPLSTTSRFFFYISDKLTMNLLLSCFGIYPTCRSVGAFTRIHQFRFSRRLTASIACPTSKQHVDIESSAVCIFIQWQKKKKGSKQRDAGAGVDVGTRSIANKMYRPCYIWLHFLSLLSVWRVHRNFNAQMTVDGYDWRGVSVQHEIRIQWTENSIMNGDLVVALPDSLPNIDKSLDACESGMKLLKLNRTENASDSIQQNRCRKPLQIVLNFYGRAFKRQKLNASFSQHSSFDERHCHLEHRMMFNSWIKITNIISFVFILYIWRWFVVDDGDVVCDSSSSNTTCAEQSAPSKMATLCMRHIRWMAKF